MGRRVYQRYSWIADDFTSARGEVVSTMTFHRGDWDVRALTRTVPTCTSDRFHLHAQLDGYERDRRVHSQTVGTVHLADGV